METTKATTLENAQYFAMQFYGSVALQVAIQEANNQEAVLAKIADVLLSRPNPDRAEA